MLVLYINKDNILHGINYDMYIINLLVFHNCSITPIRRRSRARASLFLTGEVGGVEEDSHQAATDETGNGDGHEPGENHEEDRLPVDSLGASVAQTDTDGGTSNAHGRENGKGLLGEDEDGDGGTHLHGRTTAGGVVSDLVTHFQG